MTSPISGVTTGLTTTGAGAPASPLKSLDENAFLKLLVAQMKYQDPSKPMDTNEMMAQTSTLTQVEKLGALLTAQQDLVSAQHIQTASALVGRTVSYTTPDGITATGVVTSATLSGSEPTLKVGNKDVPLSSVTEVRQSAG
jgi:flagellar basal-body rod modification protein FlgD